MYNVCNRPQIATQLRAHFRVASLVKSLEKETEARGKDTKPDKNNPEVNPQIHYMGYIRKKRKKVFFGALIQ